MGRKLFLTGVPGVGKSTLIERYIATHSAQKKDQIGGFRTKVMGGKKGCGARGVFLFEASGTADGFGEQPGCSKENMVALRGAEDAQWQTFPSVFDELGTAFLQKAMQKKTSLIIMDEIGTLEEQAKIFRQKVFEVIESEAVVLGVLQARRRNFAREVASHPAVTILEVTKENRLQLDISNFLL